jgi:hypothetical protein
MAGRTAVGSMVLALALCLPAANSNAQTDSKYPDWKGQWVRIGGGQYDPSKPGGVRQGRAFPKSVDSTFAGYSIGTWEDNDGDGHYDTLTVETRHIRGPRIYEASGIPFHKDNETVVKEKVTLDKSNPNVLVNEITTIDKALTRPWVVTRKYQRERNAVWFEFNCGEANPQITLGGQSYFLTPDGDLMPTRKDQPPPAIDLKHFEQEAK